MRRLAHWIDSRTGIYDLIQHALYGKFEPTAFVVVSAVTIIFFLLAVLAYDPGRGIMARRGGPPGEAA